MWRQSFSLLQKMGKSLMLPVSVLPVAGLLLGIGSAQFDWMHPAIAEVMKRSGGAIFDALPLIFGIAVAIGYTEGDGVAALAATVGVAVFLAAMGGMAQAFGIETKPILGWETVQTGVFGGLLMGCIAAYMFNKYYRIRLPQYLGFFAGKRFVPIVTALAAIGVAGVMVAVWPPIGGFISDSAQSAAAGHNVPRTAFIYGVVERALIPFGLHHI
jgi:PTS system glucose-specific IIC component